MKERPDLKVVDLLLRRKPQKKTFCERTVLASGYIRFYLPHQFFWSKLSASCLCYLHFESISAALRQQFHQLKEFFPAIVGTSNEAVCLFVYVLSVVFIDQSEDGE